MFRTAINNTDIDRYDVLLVGRYFCDLVFTGLPEMPHLSHEVYSRECHLVPGGVYTPAVVLTRMGIKTAWPCQFGSDPFSRFVKEQALKEGVDPAFFTDSHQPSLRITVAFSFKNERAFVSYVDPLTELPYVSLIRQTRPRWLYITHLMVGAELMELVNAARDVGARVYMDCQAHRCSMDEPEVIHVLRSVDVFSPNIQEALQLTGEQDVNRALKKLSDCTPTVIIKLGQDGCLGSQAGKTWRMPAENVDVVDTTGAGDVFNCGVLYGLLNGYSFERTLRIGNFCGGLSAQGYGGTSNSASADQFKDLSII